MREEEVRQAEQLEKLKNGAKFKVLNKEMIKTNKVGIDYRIICKDTKGNEHQLRRDTYVYEI